MEGEGEEVAEEEITVKGEVVATLGTASDTNYWANVVDATVARNVPFATKKYYLKSKES